MRIRGIGRLRPGRRRIAIPAVGAMVAALTVSVSGAPADATQAPGHDVAAWATGWSWTYATKFNYNDGNGTNATINENLTYTNAGPTTFQGQDAYKVNLSGTITGGSGNAVVSGLGTASLDSFSGSVSGTEYIRRSDLALLQESQHQALSAKAHISILSAGVTASFDIALTPDPGWRNLDFPLNSGDSWNNNLSVDYNGGFSYDAGSYGSGDSPISGSFGVNGPSHVSAATINAGGNSALATDYVAASGSSQDGTVVDNQWWSPTFKNVAQEHLSLPLDGATLVEDRTLSSASTPAPGTTLGETITPSQSCAGGPVTVSGQLSSHTSGVPVTVTLDRSVNGGSPLSATATTDGSGTYTATLTAPSGADGLGKNGARGSWGVVASGAGASNAATLVVTAQDCSGLTYTGATGGSTGTDATVSAKLGDLAGAGNVSGRTVTFALSGGGSVTGTTDASGVATATLPITGSPRTATITASYAGAADLGGSTTSAPFSVLTVPTSTAVAASAASVTVGDPVRFTATVTASTGGDPSGAVQFYVGDSSFGAPVALSGGSATSASYNTTEIADLAVHAVYLGDPTYATSTSPDVSVHVHKPLLATTTTETITPSSAVYGQPVDLSAHVAAGDGGHPTGTVSFVSGGTTLATVPVDGSGDASIASTDLGVGSHDVVAQYSGDDDYNGTSSAPTTVSVAKSPTTVDLTASDASIVSGQAVALTARVSASGGGAGTPSGSVQLKVDGNAVGSPVALDGGSATFPALDSLLAGDHTVQAVYSGDDSFGGSNDSVAEHVTKADTAVTVTANPSPSGEEENVVFTANVAAIAPGSGSPTGTVSFTADGDSIGAGTLHAAAGGGSQATLNMADLAPGTHTIVAHYGGDDAYTGGDSAEVQQTVVADAARVATSTSLSSSADPATYGQLITFTAHVTAADDSTPGGTVQFSVDGRNIGDPADVVDGTAESTSLSAPPSGTHTVIAVFTPAGAYSGSSDILTQTVSNATASVHVTSSRQHSDYGQGVTFTATVDTTRVGTGAPTGVVQFSVDGTPLGDAVAIEDGSATSPTVGDLAPGSHTVVALYGGDQGFDSASDTLTQQVDKVGTTATLTATPASSTYGDAVTLTGKVTPATTAYGLPTGSVSFVDGSTTLGTVPLTGGQATLTLNGLAAGTHSIRLVYAGQGVFADSASSAQTATVAKRATTLTANAAVVSLLPLGLPLGQLKVTLTSANGPIAGAPVSFAIGGASVCTAMTGADGVATCNASSKILQLVLANGYTAGFAGNDNYLGTTAKAGILK